MMVGKLFVNTALARTREVRFDSDVNGLLVTQSELADEYRSAIWMSRVAQLILSFLCRSGSMSIVRRLGFTVGSRVSTHWSKPGELFGRAFIFTVLLMLFSSVL